DGDVFPGIRVVFEHRVDSATLAAIAWVYGATRGNGVVAGRSGDHVHDARGGNHGLEGGHTDHDIVWVHCVGVSAVCVGRVGFGIGLRARGARGHAAKLR